MKKLGKRVLAFCLACVMALTVVTVMEPVTAEAATKSMTLYKGEKRYLNSMFGEIKSVSSDKKSVVKVSKDKKDKYKVNFNAKTTGKAHVTIKTSRGTVKYNMTVKKLDVTASLRDMGDGYLLLTVKNKTKQTFTDVQVQYVLKNEFGEVIKKDVASVSDVVAGKTVYDRILYDNYSYNVDISQCSAKVVADSRSLDAKYGNVSSKVTCKVTEDTNDYGNTVLTVKSKNTLKKDSVRGSHYILVYNSEGQIVDLKTVYFYLKAGAVDTDTTTLYAEDYSTYKVVTVAYTVNY